MREGPDIARVTSLMADPARSRMLLALMGGRALTATELASVAGITRQTASSHLAKLVEGDALAVQAQGRHRYFRLAGPDVAALVEALMAFTEANSSPTRTGPREPALRKARVCYDHLAGEMGVALYDAMRRGGWFALERLSLSGEGWGRLERLGLTPDDIPRSSRPLCRECLDWSVRRPHLAGSVGTSILDRMLALSWARRVPSSRIVRFSPEGERRFREWIR